MTHEDCERPCLIWNAHLPMATLSGALTEFQVIEEKGDFLGS
jgi:hypothetical protein